MRNFFETPNFHFQVKHYSVYACSVNLWTLHGCHVTTIEGLGSPNEALIHPVQEALYKNHGVQCGFCSPGMVMAMHAHQGKYFISSLLTYYFINIKFKY